MKTPAKLVAEVEPVTESDAIDTRHEQGRTTEEQDPAGTIVLGEWYWVRKETAADVLDEEDQELDGEEVPQPTGHLACVTELGSNYAAVTYAHGGSTRIHFNRFWHRCKHESDPMLFINSQIRMAQQQIKNVLGGIRDVIEQLGLQPTAADKSSAALATLSGARSLKAHKKALDDAEQSKLPELQMNLRSAQETLTRWLKAPALPLEAQVFDIDALRKRIKRQLFNVELYSGLVETVTTVKEGKAAPVGPLHLMQRMHFMDEECLVHYTAGGMRFKEIDAFDKWLLRKENFTRIFPFARCVVAFRVRRDEHRGRLRSFIDMFTADSDMSTFLYIRNGSQLHRLATGLDFKYKLFPERSDLLIGDGQLYIRRYQAGREDADIISEADYEGRVAEWSELKIAAEEKRAAAPNKDHWWMRDPDHPGRDWMLFTPDDVHYDEMVASVQAKTEHYNRVALVLQGLHDRTTVLHPHAKVELWNAKGFEAAIKLIHDVDLAVTSGPPPDFEAYRQRLNEALKDGSMTIGQDESWAAQEAVRENARRALDYRYKDNERHLASYRPYNNPGPGVVARVEKYHARAQRCTYAWERKRQRWVPHRQRDRDYKETLPARVTCEVNGEHKLLCIDDYELGDFKQFYADPRTRAEYLQWAPYLLAAENYKAGKHKEDDDR